VTVIDASVWVAWLDTKDAHHGAAATLLEGCQERGELLRSPSIALPEVLGSLARKGASAERQNEVLGLFTGPAIVLNDVTFELASEAARLAGLYRLRGCDAIYVALAKQHSEPFLTFDAEQKERGLRALEAGIEAP